MTPKQTTTVQTTAPTVAAEMVRDALLLTSLANSTEEAVQGVIGHLARVTPEQRADEPSGIGWRSTDELLTLVGYLLALIGSCADMATFDRLMTINTQLYEVVRKQRRLFNVQHS